MEKKILWENFLEQITSQTDSLVVMQKTLEPLAETYKVAKVVFTVNVNHSIESPNGIHESKLVYKSVKHEADLEPISKVMFRFDEPGEVIFETYRYTGLGSWTTEEGDEWKAALNIIYLHIARMNLIRKINVFTAQDVLTGIPNAIGYVRFVENLRQQHILENYAAIYYNLKGFSLVNRRYGSAETDQILIRYAKKTSDFLLPSECIGRLGGDNFVAVVLKSRLEEFLKFISSVDVYAERNGRKFSVSVSATAGIWMADNDLQEPGDVIGRTAVALNIAKYVEKVPYVYCTPEILQQMFNERQIEAEFERALNECEFVAYYQPQVDIHNYRINGAEALVRWYHNGRMMSPADFIPVLERNGSVCDLDFYMLEMVCQDIKRWEEMNLPKMPVSVNFSRKHLANPKLAEDIVSVIDRYDVDRELVEIEVTETVEENEKNILTEFLRKMRMYKVPTAIDDFGTGFSSLNMLREFQVDVLKVDRTFIAKTDWVDKIVLSNVVNMANDLKLDVIVEGVETVEQMHFLQTIGCRQVQGFLFDKPLPREEFERRLENPDYGDPSVR